MFNKWIVVGIFECGCKDGNLSSVEEVICLDKSQVEKVIKLMGKHSVDMQCKAKPASVIFKAKKLTIEGIPSEISNLYLYDSFVKEWKTRDNIIKDNKIK